MGLKVTAAATTTGLTLAEAKLHLRVDNDADDAYITTLMQASLDTLERKLGRSLAAKTYQLTLEDWPEDLQIVLPNPPLIAVTGITYVDTAGVTQTLAATQYIVNDDDGPATISPAHDVEWPEVQEQSNAITITYTAGYSPLPSPLKAAALLILGHWYENREAVITGTIATDLPLAVEFICDEYQVRKYILP